MSLLLTKSQSSIQLAIKNKGHEDIGLQLLGENEINIDHILDFVDYSAIYSKRHDLVHAVICDKLGIKFGERSVDTVLKTEAKINKNIQYYKDIKDQTPDYMSVKNDLVSIIEVTVSTDLKARQRKAAKYALLCDVLKRAGFQLDYKIFVIDPRNVYINREESIRFGLDDLNLDLINKICERAFEILREIHKTVRGKAFYYNFFEISDSNSDVKISSEDVLKINDDNKNKCFHDRNDLEKILRKHVNSQLTEDDYDFLNHCKEKIISVESEITKEEKFDQVDFTKFMISRSNTVEPRSILPLTYLSDKNVTEENRTTVNDWDDLSVISSKMMDCQMNIISTLGIALSKQLQTIKDKPNRRNEDFLFVCKFSDDEKSQIAEEGPGRKAFLKRKSKRHLASNQKHNNYALNPTVDVRDVEEVSMMFSQRDEIKDTGDFYQNAKSLSCLSGVGLNYVKCCQMIYREININSMRGDRRHKYIIKPTNLKGVYICLYPGTKLRCGDIANIVWFKIIIDNDYEEIDRMYSNHWIFKNMYRDTKVCHSRWLSVDVHRLDHYIRAYDKILMSYYAIISQRFKSDDKIHDYFTGLKDPGEISEEYLNPSDHNLIKYINDDRTNSLGLIILTYLEDRRSTSKMLQNVRYLVMTSISLYPKYNSVFEKFKEPIRSPLHLYFLKKTLIYQNIMSRFNPYSKSEFGTVKYDYKTHTFLDSLGGARIMLPRPLISDVKEFVEFSEILAEMYFTMLFNKNQDDPTHASFQVLDKIIEGENNFKEVKSRGDHLGYRQDMSHIEFADLILEKKQVHMFSSKSIEIGSKLLRDKLEDPMADQIKLATTYQNINKTLDEFATFKSSSNFETQYYNPMKKVQNTRRRCIEAVNDLLSQDYLNAIEVAEDFKFEQTYYHVFKKNQIGGVREILILPITNRIRINILETISRNICKFDRREVLTHGATKNEAIKSLLYTSKKYPGTRAPIHLTFDKSKWGPSFVPIQFLYLFTPFKKQLGNFFNFIASVLILHQNKLCILPDKLTTAWYKDVDNVRAHEYLGLQNLKKEFMANNALFYENESNMGQGILHYTSSYLHLAMISFRDKLYSMWCLDKGLSPDDHDDLLSSDDSYTLFCPELNSQKTEKFVRFKLQIFLKCQQLAEYLFNCRTSKVKSSINPLIGEFNSLFISNMTFIPTLFKFCLSSVHPPNTDSFYRMVKESYGSSRQIVENGGSLELYLISSYLNKKYCEEIYHTHDKGVNSLLKHGIENVPYHIGKFPIFNPALMVILGPEYYNYKMYKTKWEIMTQQEKHLFMVSHKVIKGGLVETMSEFEDGDTVLGGLLRIEAKIGPIKQLERIRRSAPLEKCDLTMAVTKDPLIILKKPKTMEDVKFKTTHKLYTTGSKEALKNLAASIFFGRISATVSANVFYIPNGTIKEETYSECLRHLLEVEKYDGDFDKQMKFLYPKHVDFDIFINNDRLLTSHRVRNPFEIQNIKSLLTHKIYSKLTQSVPDLLEYKWGLKPIPTHLEHKVERDFNIMVQHFPLVKDTLLETLNQFAGSEEDKIKSLLLLILKLYSLKDRSFKGVIYGFGSQDITRTYQTLIELNQSLSLTSELHESINLVNKQLSYNNIYVAHNHYLLQHFSDDKKIPNLWEKVSEKELTIFFQDHSINKNLKKRVFMIALANNFTQNLEEWSERSGVFLHHWYKKQHFEKNTYNGDFDLIVYLGHNKLNCVYDEKQNIYKFYKSNFDDPSLLFELMTEVLYIIEQKIEFVMKHTQKGPWALIDDKILKTNFEGFKIEEVGFYDPVMMGKCDLEVTDDWVRLLDNNGKRIYNVEMGLLASDTVPDQIYDFNIFGLRFVDFCKIGSFNGNFNVIYRSRTEILKCLHHLEVKKPDISKLTKKRLNLPDDWGERKIENLAEDVSVSDETNIMRELMNVQFSEEEMQNMFGESEIKADEKIDDDVKQMVEFLITTDAIFSMKTIQKIHQTRRIYLMVKYMKYDMIARMVLLDMKINKRVISTASKFLTTHKKNSILFSLISYYDRIYQYEGIKSPLGLFFDMDHNFIEKFDLRPEKYDEEISFF